MTTNKPGVLGYFAEYQKAGGQFRLSTNHFETRHDAVRFAFIDVRAVPVIRLSDYEALQDEFVIRLDELSARNYELRMGLAEKTSECEQLRKDAELWESIHDEIHRRADKEHALADRCDFNVTIMYEDYAAIDAAMTGGDQ